MYVYADPSNMTCKIIDVDCLIEAIGQTNKGKGILYITDDNDDKPSTSHLNDTEIQDLMLDSIVWKDGQLSILGKTIFNSIFN